MSVTQWLPVISDIFPVGMVLRYQTVEQNVATFRTLSLAVTLAGKAITMSNSANLYQVVNSSGDSG